MMVLASMVRLWRCGFILLVVVWTACGGVTPPAGGGQPPSRVSFSIDPVDKLDLLFMVDDSVAMIGQPELAEQLPAMLHELASLPGGMPDLHAGVITSDLGAGTLSLSVCSPGGRRAVLQTHQGCGLVDGARFVDIPRRGPSNVTVDLTRALGCLVSVGVAGCGYEHQLAAVAKALDESATPENVGFLRPDAHLAILLITDEDDCSAPPDSTLFADMVDQESTLLCALAGHVCRGVHPPAAEFTAPLSTCRASDDGPLLPIPSLVQSVRAHKEDPDRQITVAGIFAAPKFQPNAQYRIVRGRDGILLFDTICNGGLGAAAVGLRLQRYVESFGAAGAVEDICTDALTPALTRFGSRIVTRMARPCAPPLIDANPAEPGLQPDCEVVARGPGGSDTHVPSCRSGQPGPCWRAGSEPSCGSAGHVIIVEGREGLPSAHLVASCAGCVDGDGRRCE
jgi:hypothetical protein